MAGSGTRKWFERQAEREAKRDRIRIGERIGSLIGVVVSIFILYFFASELIVNTGFFTPAFGTGDQILFFGGFVVGMIAPFTRFALGRRNVARIPDMIATASFIFIGIWFVITFPFDLSHLADILPSGLQFLLSWISNDLVKALLIIAVIVSAVVLVYTAFLYRAVRQKLKVQTGA
ncbi:MAG TPA: hypothetical protein VMS79_03665 [Methanomassiliicoccales archaeon]|jgi:cytochrome bd-type quinol oxidase subunit 2|nr:hypothetical protein [Methanomassiliicoccales archaeon]